MSESGDIEVTRQLVVMYGYQNLGLTLRFYKAQQGRIFSCALICLGAEVWKKKQILFNFASGLLILLSFVGAPKIALLIRGSPVFKT